jgi:hypothetical protein
MKDLGKGLLKMSNSLMEVNFLAVPIGNVLDEGVKHWMFFEGSRFTANQYLGDLVIELVCQWLLLREGNSDGSVEVLG